MARRSPDSYTEKARKQGRLSRASFKLEEVQKKYKIIRPGDHVLELGAAPGGWTIMVERWLKGRGKIIAVDLNRLTLRSSSTLETQVADFMEADLFDPLLAELHPQSFDLLLSDAAPQTSGIHHRDVALSHRLVERAFELGDNCLKPGGSLLVKIFAGAGDQELIDRCREQFKMVRRLKPQASRQRSREFYLLAQQKVT